jgi:activating signal cointegrator complex subunit 1
VEAEQVTTSPFIWAQDVPLDRLCICQMGAKPVPYDELKGDPELGEEYTVIGQRRLGFSSASEQGL